MRKIISTIAVGAMAATGLALTISGVSQATQSASDKEDECQHYSWTGGPLGETEVPPRAPGEGWQANTTQEPHGDKATWTDGQPGLHYTGEPGKANWFDFVCEDKPEPRPTVTVTVPGPTVTATEKVEVPGPTVTATVPGPTVTVTVPGPTVTVTAVPGATEVPVPGPTVTVTAEPEPAPTVTKTVTVTETEPAPVPTSIEGGK